MNELGVFVHKFLENHEFMYEGNQEESFKDLLKFFNSGINTFDRPDGFCKYENNVLIIEHFEFDSAFKNKKGSKNRQEIFRTANVKPNNIEPIQLFRDEIKCNFTIENYINNAKENLNNHYLKIDEYERHLKQEKIIDDKTQVEVLFCIEDTTVLGNINEEGKPLFLLYCKEFIEIIKEMEKLNYIICGSSYGRNNFTWYSSIPEIGNYVKNQYSVNNTKIVNLTPHTIMGFVQVPNESY